MSETDASARAQLIKTRRGRWIDKSLLPAARWECLAVLRAAARLAVGEETYLPGWIASASDSVDWDVDELSMERIRWKPTLTEQKMEEEVDATVDALEDRGAFEGLSFSERFEFEWHVRERIRSKYESQIAHEVEEARKRNPRPKSNPSLVTEMDILNFALDVLHRHGVLNQIMHTHFMQAPLEEDDAESLAREARRTAGLCGCCAQTLYPENPAYFGVKIYVGMTPLLWDQTSKPRICEPLYKRTVLCGACAPGWLSQERDDVVTQLCGQCERPMVYRFTTSELGRTFCSDACGRVYHNQSRRERRAEQCEKVCDVCGEEFTATRNDAKTCSPKCRQKAYRRREKEVN